MFNFYILSVLLYDNECWKLSSPMESSVAATDVSLRNDAEHVNKENILKKIEMTLLLRIT